MKRITHLILFSLFFLGANLLLAQALESWDFEDNTIGDTFDAIGWDASADINAEVADDPVTAGNNVLENTIHNYNAAPVLMFVLPAGKTIADYTSFTFKGYFAQGDVGFKDIVVEAYDNMPTGQAYNVPENAVGSFNRALNGSTAWEDITIDITNTKTFTDTVFIAFGINCAGTGDVGGTGLTTMWYADDVVLVAGGAETTLVTKWGFLGNRIGDWQFSQSSDTASVGGDAQATSAWVALRGEFDAPVTATTEEALVVTGNIEFVGSGIDTWSGLRYGLFQHDSAGTLITSPADSTRWSGREDNSHGYLFTPISGTNATTDNNTQFVRVSGNYISTSTGSGPIYAAGLNRQKPVQAVATAGVYSFAFSVQPLEDGTKEVRYYLIKGDVENSAESEYYFGGSFIDTTSIAPTFNGIVFAAHTNEASGSLPDLREIKVSDVMVDVGSPITVPEAPWQDYYVDQWGFLGGRIGDWQFLPGERIGDAGIGGDAQATSAWVALRGGFVEPITATTEEALLVTGNIEFVGSGFDTWSGLRYGLFMHDSAGTVILDTAIATLPDSTRWSGREDNSHGYLFTPISGTNATTDNNTQFVRVSGNYISTSTGSGPIYAAGLNRQKPVQAVATAGVYSFAFSVQPLEDGTKEVRYYLIKGDVENSAESEYYFGGSFIDTTSIAPTFNGIVFAAHTNEASGSLPDLREILVTNVNVDIGTPFEIPQAPWGDYYVGQWGFIGENIGGWSFTQGAQLGNATVSGENPNTDLVAVRGGFENFISSETTPLKVTGKVSFEDGGFEEAGSFRFGIFYSDSAGTVVLDTAAATLPDSTHWTGTDNYHSGYLFIPGESVDWNGTQGTWGAVVNDVFFSTEGSNNYVLGTELPDPATDGAGTYDFNISVTPQGDGTTLVKANLIKDDGTYAWAVETIDDNSPLTTEQFNSIAFALGSGNTTTAMHLTDVQIDTGTITGVNEPGRELIPTQYTLNQNYPNPFNPTTTIEFALPQTGEVNLAVYDILGRKVADLIKGNLNAGYHKINFNASHLSSGVYFYRIESGDFVNVKKLMLLK